MCLPNSVVTRTSVTVLNSCFSHALIKGGCSFFTGEKRTKKAAGGFDSPGPLKRPGGVPLDPPTVIMVFIVHYFSLNGLRLDFNLF